MITITEPQYFAVAAIVFILGIAYTVYRYITDEFFDSSDVIPAVGIVMISAGLWMLAIPVICGIVALYYLCRWLESVKKQYQSNKRRMA